MTVCILIGFKINLLEFAPKLATIPLDCRDDLVTAYTDFEDNFIGYPILEQGMNSIEPVNGPIDPSDILARMTNLGNAIGRTDPQIVECTYEHADDKWD
jgi:hypothetical protein